MKEYKVVRIGRKAEDTEKMLNELAREGWRVVCSYAMFNEWIILERD